MEKFLLSWSDLFFNVLFLVIIYLVLQLLVYFLKNIRSSGIRRKIISNYIESLLIVYEPASVLFLAVVFILINPVVHGLWVALLVLLTFAIIRNYLNGRILLLVSDIESGLQIKGKGSEGVVQKMGRLGLELQTIEGNEFVNYTTLLADGFTVMKGKRTGGFHQLIVKNSSEDEQSVDLQVNQMEDKLFNCPYLDWSYKPEIQPIQQAEGEFDVRVLVKKDPHLGHLIELIEEWGYTCSLKI